MNLITTIIHTHISRLTASLMFCAVLSATPAISYAQGSDTVVTHADSLLLAKKYFSFAVQFKDIDNQAEALKNYRLSIAYNDSVYQVHYSFADFLLKTGRKSEAREEFKTALALNPSHYNSAVMLAKLYSEEALYDSTLAVYTIMHTLQPDKPELLISIASLSDFLGRSAEALAAYEKLKEMDALTEEHVRKAAMLSLKLEQWDKAAEFGKLLKKHDPGSAFADSILISAYINSGNTGQALAVLEQQSEQGETDQALLQQIVDTARIENDSSTMIQALELKLNLEPEDSDSYGELAELYLASGDRKKAGEIIESGVEANPADGKLHLLRGNMFEEAGETDKAIEAYEKAMADDRWRDSAKQFIWRLRPPETEEEKAERDFFNRGRKRDN